MFLLWMNFQLKSDQVLYLKSLKWQKSYPLQLTWTSFLQNHELYFHQKSLPVTYHNFHHKNLARPKSKSPNWKGSQPISYKANFSQKESMHPIDVKFDIIYHNKQEEISLDYFLDLMMMMNCFCGMVDQQKTFSLISSRDHCQRSLKCT